MKNFSVLLFLMFIAGCALPTLEDIPLSGEYAIPLINSEISIASLFSEAEDLRVTVDQNGTLILNYEAELVSEGIADILPRISSVGEVPIIDTVSSFSLSASDNFIITKAVLSGDEMRFRYTHDKQEMIRVTMRIPELTLDGEPFIFEHTLAALGNLPYTEFTESIDLSGYEYESEENILTLNYDARNPDGERIKLTFAAMSFNELKFSYGEGSYERTAFQVEGDSLAVNVYDGWQSGTLMFTDPRITFLITHSFGFPISLRINEVVAGMQSAEVSLEGDIIAKEISLDFPGFNEVNMEKTTELVLDNSNSNIGSLFDENINFIDYDITAIINPEGSLSTLGYATDESSFKVDARAELPLQINVSELKILDTIDVEKLFPDELTEAEFKIVTENTYPLQMEFNFTFLDENDNVLERIFENEPLQIGPAQEKTRFLNLDPDLLSKIRETKKIVVTSTFNDTSLNASPVILESDQKLDLRVGLKFKL